MNVVPPVGEQTEQTLPGPFNSEKCHSAQQTFQTTTNGPAKALLRPAILPKVPCAQATRTAPSGAGEEGAGSYGLDGKSHDSKHTGSTDAGWLREGAWANG